jgi:hypothetical protein
MIIIDGKEYKKFNEIVDFFEKKYDFSCIYWKNAVKTGDFHTIFDFLVKNGVKENIELKY